MRTLDLWLEHIETETKLPLFEQESEEYTVPTLKDVEWGSEPDCITQVARHQNLAAYKELETPGQFKEVFSWLLERDQRLPFLCRHERRLLDEHVFPRCQAPFDHVFM